ncbi:MAG: undecaprenyl-diphosphate phosphatase [Promethearchaeota archaeon]
MIEIIILAILFGILEMLPISPFGQVMIMILKILNLEPDNMIQGAFWLQFGSFLAIIIKFRSECLKILRSLKLMESEFRRMDINRRNWLIFSSIGTIFTVLPFYYLFKYVYIEGFNHVFGDLTTLIIAGILIGVGITLIRINRIFGTSDFQALSNKELRISSFLSGLMQGLAILPGVSRPALTVSVNLLENNNQETALKLSFMMHIPFFIISLLFEALFKGSSIFEISSILNLFLSLSLSFLGAYLMMSILINLVRKLSFNCFCIFYGLLSFILIIPSYIFSALQ